MNGLDALAVWRAHGATADVLVTDLRMPELAGGDLASRLRAEAPELAVVYISGYAAETITPPIADRTGRPDVLLQKPFTSDDLRAAIERVTAERRDSAG